MKLTCPHCHKPFTYTGTARVSAGRPARSAFESSHRFGNVAGVTNDLPGLNARREQTLFLPTFESNVLVPRGQAITSALFAGPFWGIVTGSTAYVIGGPFWGVTGWQSIQAGFVAGLGMFFWVAWRRWEYSAAYYDDLLLKVEEMTGLDLNQDGEIGEPDSLKLEISDGKRQHLEEWPVSKAALVQFARAVASDSPNDTFSERTARECGISREQFTFVRERFFRNHWAAWKNPQHPQAGIMLRSSGRAVLAAVAAGQLPAGVQPGDDIDDDFGMSPHYVRRDGKAESWG